MTMNGWPSHSPTSKIVTTDGSNESRAAASASRVNRLRTVSSPAYRAPSTLIATRRWRTVSVAQ